MTFYLVISSVLLSWFVFGPTYVISPLPIEVTVSNKFEDGRHVTFACLSYQSSIDDKILSILNPPTESFVSWTVPQFNRETLQKCHMVWQRGDGEVIRAVFKAFIGSLAHDQPSLWDQSTQELKYLWRVNEDGLLLYNFVIKNYYVATPMSSLPYIEVSVISLLENGQAVSILCISKEASGHSELLALDSFYHGAGVGWTISDFNKETTQVCHVHFSHRGGALVFEAFVGSWIHDLSIWDVHKRKRIYYWVLKDRGLFLHNYRDNTEELILKFGS